MSAGDQLLRGGELCSEQGMVLGENWKNVILFLGGDTYRFAGGHLMKGDLELSSGGRLKMLLKHCARNITNVSCST